MTYKDLLQGEVLARRLYLDAVERQSIPGDPEILNYIRCADSNANQAQQSQPMSQPLDNFDNDPAPKAARQTKAKATKIISPLQASISETEIETICSGSWA